MFSAARAAALSEVEWDAKRLEYIEAWNFRDDGCGDIPPHHHREGVIPKEKCIDWLHHRDQFALPDIVEKHKDKIDGGLRLLICDRTSLFPPGFGMTRDAFVEAERVLNLHKASLPSFLVANGTHSRYITKSEGEKGELLKLDLVLKAPQKYEIANYGLSISFDVKTKCTTALLFGESVTETSWAAMGRQVAKNAAKKEAWEYQSPRTQILKLLRESQLPWSHPLLLPCSLMSDHLARMRAFCEGELTKDVMEIERELGVVRVGNRSEHGMSGLWPHFRLPKEEEDWTNALLDRPTVMNGMTVRINSQYTTVIFSKRSPLWSLETSEFLLNLWQKFLVDKFPPAIHDDFLAESLEYTKDVAASIQNHVDNLQTRMDLQLNILYSFVAQKDNRLNTRIARSSGRDSVSMKILAFISAIFLPPSYIAALFAMQGLFNWEPGGGDGSEPLDVVNDKFWIYWATAVPLTLFTLIGWAIWWRYEMKRYPMDDDDKVAPPPPGFVAQIRETLGWGAAEDVAPPEKKKRDNWVFGGRRRESKLGIDGNPNPSDLMLDTEAGAGRHSHFTSPFTSPKSPLQQANSRPF